MLRRPGASAGKIRFYGVSVERVEEALKAIEYPGVQSVQIIYNMFRQRPAELFFAEAKRRQVGILARLPLSSGMLAGKMTRAHVLRRGRPPHLQPGRRGLRPRRDLLRHRLRDRPGAGRGAAAAGAAGREHGAFALRWILMDDAVTCAIPGAKRPAQVEENVGAADLPPLSAETMAAVGRIYERSVRPLVHQRW